jgi:hypothetical protein
MGRLGREAGLGPPLDSAVLPVVLSVTSAPATQPKQEFILRGLTPNYALRFSAAITLFGAGMHYLVAGRKEADLNKMFLGAVLAIASVFCL